MVFNVILSVVLGLAVAFFAATAMQLLASDGSFHEVDESGVVTVKRFAGFNQVGSGWYWAVGAGAIVGLVNYFAPVIAKSALPGIAVFFLVVMIALYVLMMIWWAREGGSAKEMMPFIILAVLMFFTTSAAASATAVVIPDVFWKSVITTTPGVLLVVSIGFFVANLCFFRHAEIDTDEGEKTRDLVLTVVASVVTAVIALALLVSGVAWGSLAPKSAYGDVAASIQVSEEEYNAQAANTLYGGMEVSDELSHSSLTAKDEERVKATGISDALTFPMTASDDAGKMNEVYCEIMTNPIYCLTIIKALKDEKIGDQTIGDNNSWMGEAVKQEAEHGVLGCCEYRGDDKSKVYLTQEYRCTATATVALLKRFVVQGVQNRTTVKNWCLNSASLDNQRQGILAPYQYTGDFLVLAYVGKNELGKEKATGLLVFGLNLKDKRPAFFGEKPETVTGVSTVPGTPSTSNNPTPTPTPTPTPDEPKKDPSKLTPINTEPNDNTGPGENTIDPSDYNHSSKDRSDNSTSYPSYDAYREDMDHLADVNNNQRVGGDSNQPSTETPSGTTVDNNGANGTGYGGADAATPISQPAETTDGSAVTKSGGDGAWGNGIPPA